MEPPIFDLVKGLLAIFCCVMLIASQAVASLNGPLDLGKQKADTRECCSHRSCCAGSDCCVGKKNSGSEQPTPVAPPHGYSQNDLQILVSASLLLWQQSATASAMVPASFFLRPSVAVPLYQRNCSYLI